MSKWPGRLKVISTSAGNFCFKLLYWKSALYYDNKSETCANQELLRELRDWVNNVTCAGPLAWDFILRYWQLTLYRGGKWIILLILRFHFERYIHQFVSMILASAELWLLMVVKLTLKANSQQKFLHRIISIKRVWINNTNRGQGSLTSIYLYMHHMNFNLLGAINLYLQLEVSNGVEWRSLNFALSYDVRLAW